MGYFVRNGNHGDCEYTEVTGAMQHSTYIPTTHVRPQDGVLFIRNVLRDDQFPPIPVCR
jgi:hypothetical protein